MAYGVSIDIFQCDLRVQLYFFAQSQIICITRRRVSLAQKTSIDTTSSIQTAFSELTPRALIATGQE